MDGPPIESAGPRPVRLKLRQSIHEAPVNRKKLSLDDLRIDSFVTAESGAVQFGSTIDDPGSTSPPRCNSIQTCVC
jgi:hypothetical protein